MKASKLIEWLQEAIKREGDIDVYIETSFQDKRSCQKAMDLLSNGNRMIIVSQEAVDADPLFSLPEMPHLRVVEDFCEEPK